MSNPLLRVLVRSWFKLSTRNQVSRKIAKLAADYRWLADDLEAESGRESVTVPTMPGVDPEMRDWSFYMLLEHNTIVNRGISSIVEHLSNGTPLSESGKFNPKTDVLPEATAGPDQVIAFQESVEAYLEMSEKLVRLRKTQVKQHPVFGMLDAHGWHCMFGFHLQIHMKQARLIVAGCRPKQ
ncbi:MAG: hypothetical protein AAGC73_08745 [Verrucomicrobiota bacterium]